MWNRKPGFDQGYLFITLPSAILASVVLIHQQDLASCPIDEVANSKACIIQSPLWMVGWSKECPVHNH